MPYDRRILHYSPGPTDLQGEISARTVQGLWFELHRQGGCGDGELRLPDEFADRDQIDVGDWIAVEYTAGDRWYFGRVRQRVAGSPAGIRLRLEGMSAQLAEAFPGGFGSDIADGVRPHRYASTDLFPHDPDRDDETVDAVDEPHELVSLLMDDYVVPATDIAHDPELIEPATQPAGLTSIKFRGEESVRSVLPDLAVRARNASWGVDETGTFFFLQPRQTVLATFREGVDTIVLEEHRDRDLLFNRVVLTGGIVYDPPDSSGVVSRGFYRWRGNYIQPQSRAQYGERRIRLWVPWIRTRDDAREFIREFFRVYSTPTTRYVVEVGNQTALPRPWLGRVRLEDIGGNELVTAQVESVRVEFDGAPRLRMEIGPPDPRRFWPQPAHDERTVIPHDPQPDRGGGDLIDLTSSGGSFCGGSLLCDRFTDGDGTSLDAHLMDVGSGWTELKGDWEIIANRARSIGSTPAEPKFVAAAEAGEADVEVLATINPAGGSTCGIVIRLTDEQNLWLVDLDVQSPGNAKLRLFERNAGTWFQRASTSGVDAAAGSDSTLSVTADGTTITGELDDDSTVSYSSATHNQTATEHGLRADVADCRFDDFRVTAL